MRGPEKHTVQLKSKLPPSRESRSVSLETRLVSREIQRSIFPIYSSPDSVKSLPVLFDSKCRKEHGRKVLWVPFVPSPFRIDAACRAGKETQTPDQRTPDN